MEFKEMVPFMAGDLVVVYCDAYDYSRDFKFVVNDQSISRISDRSAYMFPALKSLDDYKDGFGYAMNQLNCDITDQIQIQDLALGSIGVSGLFVSAYEVLVRNQIDLFCWLDTGKAFDYAKLDKIKWG